MKGKKEAIEDEDQTNWIITYQDGKKEKYQGTAEAAFDHALSKAKIFAVEKSSDQSVPKRNDRKKRKKKQPTFTIIMGGVCVG